MKYLLLALLFQSCVLHPAVKQVTATAPDTVALPVADTVRLLFAGDVMGHGMQITGAWHDGGDSCYNYHPAFQWASNQIAAADVAVANLEVTLAGAPYRGYPRFSSHHALADALQVAGFDVFLTANNHVLDRGKSGLLRTLDVLDSIKITHTGTFRDSAERNVQYPLLIEKNGFRLAMLNNTYGTNGIAAEKPVAVNYIDTLQMAADITKAQQLNPDFIIACMHWGDEYSRHENATQRKLADFLARSGCHLIIGGHPHVVQPLVKTPVASGDSVLVAYSLGNFISNQRDRYRDGGITLALTLIRTNNLVSIHSIDYEPFWVHCYRDSSVSVFRLIRINDFILRPERYPAMSKKDSTLMMQFYNDTKELITLPMLLPSGK